MPSARRSGKGRFTSAAADLRDPYLDRGPRRRGPDARLFSCLGDACLAVRPDLGALALAGLSGALAPLGHELDARKTPVWSPAVARAAQPELAEREEWYENAEDLPEGVDV